MSLDSIIKTALEKEAARQEAINERKRAAEALAAQKRDRVAVVFRDAVIPALEDARQRLTASAIECSLTNGQDPDTKKVRHGLSILWRGGQHSLTFTATDQDTIVEQVVVAGRPVGSIRGQPFSSTPQDAVHLVLSFVGIALDWMPPEIPVR